MHCLQSLIPNDFIHPGSFKFSAAGFPNTETIHSLDISPENTDDNKINKSMEMIPYRESFNEANISVIENPVTFNKYFPDVQRKVFSVIIAEKINSENSIDLVWSALNLIRVKKQV